MLVVPRLGGRPGHTVGGDLALSRAGVSDPVEQEVPLVSSGAARTVAVLPDWLSLLSFDQQHGRYVLAQLSWSPHKGLRPDLERQLQVWDLTGEVPPWTAQPRFQADEARIDTEAGTVTLKSKRYGTTVLGLTDGHLVSDRLGRSGLRAREPRYPGVAGD